MKNTDRSDFLNFHDDARVFRNAMLPKATYVISIIVILRQLVQSTLNKLNIIMFPHDLSNDAKIVMKLN